MQSLYPMGIPLLVFAINTTKRWSNAAQNEFDVVVDVNNDGTPDYDVVAADLGALTTGTVNGIVGIGVFNLATRSGSINYLADAPTDSNTMTLPVDFSQLCDPGSPCLSAANPRFTYTVQSFGLTDNTSDTIDATAQFNAFAPSLSTGMFDTVAPNASVTEPVTLDPGRMGVDPLPRADGRDPRQPERPGRGAADPGRQVAALGSLPTELTKGRLRAALRRRWSRRCRAASAGLARDPQRGPVAGGADRVGHQAGAARGGHDAEAHAEGAVRARDHAAEVGLPRVDRDRDALAAREVRAGDHERLPMRELQHRGRPAAGCGRGEGDGELPSRRRTMTLFTLGA